MSEKPINEPVDQEYLFDPKTQDILAIITKRGTGGLPVEGATKVILAESKAWQKHCEGFQNKGCYLSIGRGCYLSIGRRLSRMKNFRDPVGQLITKYLVGKPLVKLEIPSLKIKEGIWVYKVTSLGTRNFISEAYEKDVGEEGNE